MIFNRLQILIILYLLLIPSWHIFAETPEQAEEAFSNAQNTYFKALKSGKYNTPEEKGKLLQSTIGAANAKLSEAAHEQTERLREQEIERQRSNAAAYAQKKSIAGILNQSTDQTPSTEARRVQPSSASGPTEEPIAIDGSSTPKELIFPGNKAKPHRTKK